MKAHNEGFFYSFDMPFTRYGWIMSSHDTIFLFPKFKI